MEAAIEGLGKELLEAINRQDVEEVESILDKGFDPNIKHKNGTAPLHTAAGANSVEILELLLERGADQNVRNGLGSTPLHLAARGGHERIVQILLEFWAHPNKKNCYGLTPLHEAAKQQSFNCVWLLLEEGADPKTKDKTGLTPLDYADDDEVVRLLLGVGQSTKNDVQYKKPAAWPKFPITINGNALSLSTDPAVDSSQTNYIVVQTWAALSPPQQQRLQKGNVFVQNCVCENTYVCKYQDADLDWLRNISWIVYVDVYRQEMKMESGLKEKTTSPDLVEVDVILHDALQTMKGQNLGSADKANLISCCRNIEEEFGGLLKELHLFPDTIQVTLPGVCLNDLAMIDEICMIYEVRKLELRNGSPSLDVP